MKLTLLGTGSTAGAPVYGCDCSACQRARTQPEHARGPCSALLETPSGRLLIDAGQADLKERFPSGSLRHILLTHYHMDHVHGLFPLRWGVAPRIQVIGPEDPTGCDDLFKHPGILDFSVKAGHGRGFSLLGAQVLPLALNHSRPTLGYRIGPPAHSLAYLTDTCGLPEDTLRRLKAEPPAVLLLDCSYPPRPEEPRGHNALNDALAIHTEVRPARTLLTHVGHELDCWLMDNPLPDGVAVASDGTAIDIP
jgi:phosphoribosyl 1,2-cyclic phosphate phosphodiesterase